MHWPQLAVICGSGLEALTNKLNQVQVFDNSDTRLFLKHSARSCWQTSVWVPEQGMWWSRTGSTCMKATHSGRWHFLWGSSGFQVWTPWQSPMWLEDSTSSLRLEISRWFVITLNYLASVARPSQRAQWSKIWSSFSCHVWCLKLEYEAEGSQYLETNRGATWRYRCVGGRPQLWDCGRRSSAPEAVSGCCWHEHSSTSYRCSALWTLVSHSSLVRLSWIIKTWRGPIKRSVREAGKQAAQKLKRFVSIL